MWYILPILRQEVIIWIEQLHTTECLCSENSLHVPSLAWSCIWNFFWASISLIAISFSNSACCFWYSASCNLRSSSAVWGASLSNSNSCSGVIAACWCDWSFLSSCDTVACFAWRECDRASTSLLRWLMFALQASICCDLRSESFFVSVSCCYKNEDEMWVKHNKWMWVIHR